MKIQELFTLYQGNSFELLNMKQSQNAKINFISRTSQNNGVVAVVDENEVKPFAKGLITVALGGSVLSSFVQDKPFYTAFHIMVLESKIDMKLEQKLFYCAVIQNNAFRYSYGRQANKTLKDLYLPDIDECNKIIGNSKIKPVKTKIKEDDFDFDTTDWKEFKVGDIFEVSKTYNINYDDLECDGEIPYVTRTTKNNGVEKFVNPLDYKLYQGNCICIGGESAFAAYQNQGFLTGNNITVIRCNHLNKYIGLFLVALFNNENFKYSYGRAFNMHNVKNTVLNLPTINDQPDWDYMENYIKQLPYSDKI
jgi:hypothetical protein